jgi:hypothetical protein
VLKLAALLGGTAHPACRLKPWALAHKGCVIGAARLAAYCKLSTLRPARGPSAMR